MKIEREEYSNFTNHENVSKYQKLMLDDDTYAEVINITDTKVRIGLVIQSNQFVGESSLK